MADITPHVGLGTTVTFANWTAQVKSIDGSGISCEDLETTSLSTTGGYKTFDASDLKDAGEITLEVFYDGAMPTIGGAGGSLTIAFAGGSTMTQSKAYIKSFAFKTSPNEHHTATLTIKCAGAWS